MKKTNCRVCGGNLSVLLYDFGEIPIIGFAHPGEVVPKVSLRVVRCDDCGLVQLGDTFDLDGLYKNHYWYQSGLNVSMVDSLRDVVRSIESKKRLRRGQVVVDIGCNDGTMLGLYSSEEIIKVGFDPAPNLSEKAKLTCDLFINDYFSFTLYPGCYMPAAVVTSIAMFYDLDDPNTFIDEVKTILADDGIWVIQLTDLYSMIRLNEFTSFCPEHLVCPCRHQPIFVGVDLGNRSYQTCIDAKIL